MKRSPWPWILLGIVIAAAVVAVPALGGVGGAREDAKAPTLKGVAKQVTLLKKQVAILKKRKGPVGPLGPAGTAGARGPSSGLQARQAAATTTLTGSDQTLVMLSLPAAGTYVLTARAGVSASANPVTNACTTGAAGMRGGAQMTFAAGATTIEAGALLLNPNYVAFGNCLANAVWSETAVVTTTGARDVVIKAREPLGASITDSAVSGAAITAVQVDSGTGATAIP